MPGLCQDDRRGSGGPTVISERAVGVGGQLKQRTNTKENLARLPGREKPFYGDITEPGGSILARSQSRIRDYWYYASPNQV